MILRFDKAMDQFSSMQSPLTMKKSNLSMIMESWKLAAKKKILV